MRRWRVIVYFEPDSRDAMASWIVEVEADSEDEAIEKAKEQNFLGFSVFPYDAE